MIEREFFAHKELLADNVPPLDSVLLLGSVLLGHNVPSGGTRPAEPVGGRRTIERKRNDDC